MVLWALLALFVLYPCWACCTRVVMDGGRLAPGAALAVLPTPNQLRAFSNSLLLAALVGMVGTVLGFLFALTASRAGLGGAGSPSLDAVTLLPLISPPFTTAIAMIFSFGPRGLITYRSSV